VPSEKITAFTFLGLAYNNARKRSTSANMAAAIHNAYGKKFCHAVLKSGLGEATATYTFNSAGLELMKVAKESGLKTVMEQTIAPRAVELEILAEAAQRYPQWAQAIPAGPDIDEFVSREEEEWKHADLILCGSAFVRDGIGLRGGPVDKCRVVPYGVDSRFHINRGPRLHGPLRVLTVGQVGLRKGSPVVWEAARIVGRQAEFRMVGDVAVPVEVLVHKPENVILVGAVPRREIDKQYRWADVFLLPSLCEGSATVTYEAMMSGLPVVCSENTGSIIENGVSGFIVKSLDVEQVAECLQRLAQQPDFLAGLSTAARAVAGLASIEAYRQRLLATLEEMNR
jgi:glycosyltransferase involved in cell wall biosynthesis